MGIIKKTYSLKLNMIYSITVSYFFWIKSSPVGLGLEFDLSVFRIVKCRKRFKKERIHSLFFQSSHSTKMFSNDPNIQPSEMPRVVQIYYYPVKLKNWWQAQNFLITGSSRLMRISLLQFFKTITMIQLMPFYGRFILLLRSSTKNLANAIFG